MNFPKINQDDCPSDIAGGGGAGGDVQSLVLKPGTVTSCAGEVQFEAFIKTDNAGETRLTDGLTFLSSNNSVVVIDATTGMATLLTTGIATISVSYGSLTAFSQVDVIGEGDDCCTDTTVATMVVVDNSKSMGLMTGIGGTRLDFAKTAANTLLAAMRWDKDVGGLMRFNVGTTILQAISSTQPASGLIFGIPQSTQQTDIEEMLDDALAELADETADRRVLVIISDGENRPTSSGVILSPVDILAKAAAFKDAGGVIVCVGCSASGDGFALLQAMASGGFFVNAWDVTTSETALVSLVGFLCYYCGGLPVSYGYCLAEPVVAQIPNPEPLADPEISSQQLFTSTKRVCVICEDVSAANLITAMDGPASPAGVASASGSSASTVPWFAFDGEKLPIGADPHYWQATILYPYTTTADTFALPVWLQYKFASATVVGSYAITNYLDGVGPGWFKLQGSADGSSWVTVDEQQDIRWGEQETQTFAVASPGSFTYYRLYVTDAATSVDLESVGPNGGRTGAIGMVIAELEMFSPTGAERCATATSSSYVSQAEADSLALAAATTAAEALCGSSNNEDAIQFNNGTDAPATAYPSRKFVSGLTGTITDITVQINGLKHLAAQVISLVLRAPDGTAVMLMSLDNLTYELIAATAVDIVFDDAAAGVIPHVAGSNALAAGTYKPTVDSPGATHQLPSPAPTQPYGTALSDFDGIDPNGEWTLWAAHKTFYTVFNPANARMIDGWDLTITSS